VTSQSSKLLYRVDSGLVASYDTRPGNKIGLSYKDPETTHNNVVRIEIPRQMISDKHRRQKWQRMYAKTTMSRRNVAPLASSRRAILTPSDMSVNNTQHTHSGW